MAQGDRLRTPWKARGAALVYIAVVVLWVGSELVKIALADPAMERVPWKTMIVLFPSSVVVDALPSTAPRFLGGLMLLQPLLVFLACWALDRAAARRARTTGAD